MAENFRTESDRKVRRPIQTESTRSPLDSGRGNPGRAGKGWAGKRNSTAFERPDWSALVANLVPELHPGKAETAAQKAWSALHRDRLPKRDEILAQVAK